VIMKGGLDWRKSIEELLGGDQSRSPDEGLKLTLIVSFFLSISKVGCAHLDISSANLHVGNASLHVSGASVDVQQSMCLKST
jgi:hypothetical protein